MARHTSLRLILLGSIALSLTLHGGCGRRQSPTVEFEPNLVQAMKYQIKEGVPMDQATTDSTWVVATMFGTPDEPKLPRIVTESEDEPWSTLVSMERLVAASGPKDVEGRGLFRKHCANCHGDTGNGRGPNAFEQTPYPRDYRLGIFKFKSTPRGVKPTRDDLSRTIRDGIAGTAMKKIPELSEEDIQSLVDYVIYLSWRGELERTLIDEGVMELDLGGGDRITNSDFGQRLLADAELGKVLKEVNEETDGDELVAYENYLAFGKRLDNEPGLQERLEKPDDASDDDPKELDDAAQALAEQAAEKLALELEQFEAYQELAEELESDAELEPRLKAALATVTAAKATGNDLLQLELYDEATEYNDEFVTDIADSWLEAADEVLEVPSPPADIPVADSYDEFQTLMQGERSAELVASVKRGQELFVGKIAACNKCHGDKGLGNGQTTDYDDWVKDWTLRVGLKPDDEEALIPLLARGAMKPVNAIPRNFQEGIFRGGARAADLYRRATQGIDGTPMPAATFVEGQFEQDDVWHIVNFVRSLQVGETPPPAPQKSPVQVPTGSTPETKETPAKPKETPAV